MRIVIDLDGVICKLKKPNETYSDVEPNLDVIRKIKEWKKEGHIIIIYTSRYMRTCKGNVKDVIEKIGKITLDWLKKWDVPYDEIYFGKPYGDIYIDDLCLTYSSIEEVERRLESLKPIFLIPMAGLGKRFFEVGYRLPKFMIEAKGKPMLEWALDSLPLDIAKKIIFICLKEHEEKFSVVKFIDNIKKRKFPNLKEEIILLKEVTRGQAETVLAAKKYINNDSHIVIYNVDSYFVSSRLKSKLLTAKVQRIDGILGAFNDTNPKWSYIELDSNGFVKRTAEKEAISDIASTGLYTFTRGRDFVRAATYMIKNDMKVKNEFYVAPIYNILINEGKKFIVDFAEKFWSLGTPEDLEYFIKNYSQEVNI